MISGKRDTGTSPEILDFRFFQTIGTYITEDTGNTAAPLLNYVHALESSTDCNSDRT